MPGYDTVIAEATACLRHYAAALGLPGHVAAYAEAIAPACWDAFPRGSKLHKPAVFAETVTFHAMKAAGLPFDQAAFRAASLVGDMPMTRRDWLLHYAARLPPALRVASREASPEAWFARMPPHPAVARARAICASGDPRLSVLRPRARAGACVVVAWRIMGPTRGERPSIAELLAPAGIHLASAYNGAVRAGLVARGRSPAAAHGDAPAALA